MAEAFITRRGGGASSKLKVTAYAAYGNLPASADDGAVAVITSTAINKLYIDAVQPSSPVTGDVWFKTNSLGKQSVPILLKPFVTVYPSTTVQYNGSAWVYVRALVYHSYWYDVRAWLYDTGNMYAETGGNWVVDSLEAGYGTITFGASAMILTHTIPGTGGCQVRKSTAFDFSPFSSLKVVVKKTSSASTGQFWVDVMQGTTSLGQVAAASFNQNETRTLSLDVTAMNATANPRLKTVDAATFEVQQVWLE